MTRLVPCPPAKSFRTLIFTAFIWSSVTALKAADSAPTRTALSRTIDLDTNETQEVELADLTRVRLKLLSVVETRDAMRDAVRQALVKIELNGQSLVLTSATYHLPVTFAGAQVDCPVTGGCVGNSSQGNAWGLMKDARLRLWPAASPWIEADTFSYPLDGAKSWSAAGKVARYDWTFTDGTAASGPAVERAYSEPGEYSEILRITDARGEFDYDFAIVIAIDKSAPDRLPPTIHPAFAPTMNIRPGDSVTFKVRSFRTTVGQETWDFGDWSGKVTVKSDGNVTPLAKDGYAVTQHRFERPGHYLVRVERTNEHGLRAIAHLHVPVERPGAAPDR